MAVYKLKNAAFIPAKFLTDDNIPTDGKSVVIDVYYKKRDNGRTILHYCKYVGNEILYSTENEQAAKPSAAPDAGIGTSGTLPIQRTDAELNAVPPIVTQDMSGQITGSIPMQPSGMMPPPIPQQTEHFGLYDHGLYPFVFDVLYPIEGSPCGYGYIDLCQNSQMQIDVIQTAMLKNTMVGAIPRYFARTDGSINEEEFLDLNNPVVHVNSNLGQDSLKLIDHKPLNSNYLNIRTSIINELRETSGNTEAANGVISSGVTAASAIAALQEASGKGSRDSSRTSYRAYAKIVNLCIELIRQFYDMPRQFRITGQLGAETFVKYSNENIRMQMQGGDIMTARLPEFDIKVSPAKRSSYSRITQNELALQFYNLGFFNPNMTDQALACCYMMDFDGKDTVMQMINYNGTMAQQLATYQQYALAMTQKYEPERVEGLAAAITGGQAPTQISHEKINLANPTEEDTRVQNTRAKSQSYSQPEA